MEFTYKKEKNLVSFMAEGKEKPYIFDINTGKFFSLTGKELVSFPKGFKDWLPSHCDTNVLKVLYRLGKNYKDSKFFVVADKLENIKYSLDYYEVDNNLIYINQHFKQFAKYYKENPNATINGFIEYNTKIKWMQKYNLENSNLPSGLINMLYSCGSLFGDRIPLVVYYITHGLYDFYNCEPVSVSFSNTSPYRAMLNKIEEYFNLCDELNVIPQKEDMLRSYVNLRRTSVMNRATVEVEKIKQFYDKHNFAFEDDEFKVIVPQSREDFLNEANMQRNCVYSNYLPAVLKGNSYIVFIRKKDNLEKSYITCEITSKGTIVQCRSYANNSIAQEDKPFIQAYQNFLMKNW